MKHHFYFITVIILLLLTVLTTMVNSDSGYFIIDPYYDTLSFSNLPVQSAIIYYKNGYELLIVISKYSLPKNNNTYNVIYYFPLPSKPIYYNILFTNVKSISIRNNVEYDLEELKDEFIDLLTMHYLFYFYYEVAVSGGGSTYASPQGYEVLSTLSGETYNVSLIKTSSMNISVFREILYSLGYKKSLPNGLNDIIAHYRELGWKYLVVGVANVSRETIIIQTYILKTNKIVYPLYVDRLQRGTLDIYLLITSDEELSRKIFPDLILREKGFNPIYKIVFHKPATPQSIENFFEKLYCEARNLFGEQYNHTIELNKDNLVLRISLKGITYYCINLSSTPSNIRGDIITSVKNGLGLDPKYVLEKDYLLALIHSSSLSIGRVSLFLYFPLYVKYVLMLSSFSRESVRKFKNYLSIGFLFTSMGILFMLYPFKIFLLIGFAPFFPKLVLLAIVSPVLFLLYHVAGYHVCKENMENTMFIKGLWYNYLLFYILIMLFFTPLSLIVKPVTLEFLIPTLYPQILIYTYYAPIGYKPHINIVSFLVMVHLLLIYLYLVWIPMLTTAIWVLMQRKVRGRWAYMIIICIISVEFLLITLALL